MYVLVVTLSDQDNVKLLVQLKSGFKRTINWNKYQSKVSTEAQNPYLDYLVDPSFQEVNRLFALLFEKSEDTTTHTHNIIKIKDSSNIDEVIRSVLNFLSFFYYKISQVRKSIKRIQGTKNTNNLRFINLKFIDIRFIDLKFIDIIFINLKFIDIRFIKLKKHLSGEK